MLGNCVLYELVYLHIYKDGHNCYGDQQLDKEDSINLSDESCK